MFLRHALHPQVFNAYGSTVAVHGVTSNCWKCRKPLLVSLPAGGVSAPFVVMSAHAYSLDVVNHAGVAVVSTDLRLDEHGV